jgi:hypothetical protein
MLSNRALGRSEGAGQQGKQAVEEGIGHPRNYKQRTIGQQTDRIQARRWAIKHTQKRGGLGTMQN